MVTETREVRRTVSTDEPVAAAAAPAEHPSYVAARVIWFIAGVIIVLLALRFFFILAGANAGNGFVDFIYNVSYPFAWPFFGIFSYHTNYGLSRVEWASLIGIVVYAIVAWGLARLVTIRRPQPIV